MDLEPRLSDLENCLRIKRKSGRNTVVSANKKREFDSELVDEFLKSMNIYRVNKC